MNKIITSVLSLSAVLIPVAAIAQDAAETVTLNRLAQMEDEDGQYYRFSYDGNTSRVLRIDELTYDRAYCEYTYNDKGQCVTELMRQEIPVSSGNFYDVAKVEYTYDEQGHMLTRINYNRPNATSPTAVMELVATQYYAYDSDGRVALMEEYWGADKISRNASISYTYDSDGRLEKEVFTYFNMTNEAFTSDESRYTYDSEGRLVKKCNLEGDIENGNQLVVRSWVNYVYDEDGNLVERYKTGATDSPDNKQESVLYTVDNAIPADQVVYPVIPEPYYGSSDWGTLLYELIMMDDYVFDLDTHESTTLHAWTFDYDQISVPVGIGNVAANFGKSLAGVTVNGDNLRLHGVLGADNVRIFDLNGRCVKSLGATGNTISLSGLAKGAYVITTSAGTAKFIR